MQLDYHLETANRMDRKSCGRWLDHVRASVQARLAQTGRGNLHTLSDESAMDPVEAFVASLSSFHMLWLLSIAANQKFRVDRYLDAAVGVMGKNTEGKMAMTVVTLRPEVHFSGERLATREQINQIHHEAHEQCFIANLLKTEVRCAPVL